MSDQFRLLFTPLRIGTTTVPNRILQTSLKREIRGRMQDRVMFGSDHPFIHVERWLADFEQEGYNPDITEKVLYKNAQRILKLQVGAPVKTEAP